MNKPLRIVLLFFLLCVILAASAVLSLMFGGSDLPLRDALSGLFHPGAGDTLSMIVWQIRIPRMLLGMIVGLGLAVCGCAFQGMLRNPLADPYTLGISGGAAFGASVGVAAGLAQINSFLIPLCAFGGTMASVALVYGASMRKGFSLSSLILSGVILGFLFSSLVLLVYALADSQKVYAAILWLMGDLSSADTRLLRLCAAIILPGCVLLAFYGRELDILTLGEEKASHLGMDIIAVKKLLFLVASLVTGACVSVSGIIGFVGLIIPHAMRPLTGSRHELLIPASALAGAAFLTLSDTVARTALAPVELPVGVITGIAGGAFFLYFLLIKSHDRIL